jgi:long-subunit acyl-CoA synthetase (AMP-forming)
VLILNRDGQAVPAETEGEIGVVGPNVMLGYYKKPEATAECIIDVDGKRCFRTGDLGVLSADGILRITGRLKEQCV